MFFVDEAGATSRENGPKTHHRQGKADGLAQPGQPTEHQPQSAADCQVHVDILASVPHEGTANGCERRANPGVARKGRKYDASEGDGNAENRDAQGNHQDGSDQGRHQPQSKTTHRSLCDLALQFLHTRWCEGYQHDADDEENDHPTDGRGGLFPESDARIEQPSVDWRTPHQKQTADGGGGEACGGKFQHDDISEKNDAKISRSPWSFVRGFGIISTRATQCRPGGRRAGQIELKCASVHRYWVRVYLGLLAGSAAGCAFGTEELEDKDPPFVGTGGKDAGVSVNDSGWGTSGSGGQAAAAGAGGSAGLAGSAGTAGTGALPGGPCTPGEKQNLGACDKCGTSERTCSSAGQWNAPTCENQGACKAGEMQTQPCGTSCGAQTRKCESGCTWGGWSTCVPGGVCTPGQKETQPCGNCGSQTRTCRNDCTWDGFLGCTGEGVCKAGTTQAGGCDSCSQKVCQSNCTWGACQLKSGNQCNYQSGTNFKCCGTDKWQFCSSSCQWFPCQSCNGSSGCLNAC